jgi:DNA-binding CsgD family transcriptional regulator
MLVGRERELRALGDRIAENRGIAVVGIAGVGKTALLREAARASGRDVFEGGALASLAWMSFLPLTRALGQPPTGDHAAVATLVRERVGDGLLVLDDLHWADPDTLAVVPLLTANRVSLIAAVRAGDGGTDAACDALREANVELLDVEELQPEEATRLLRERHPDLDEGSLARILSVAGGSPFFLEELAASPEPSATLRLALRARLDRCSVDARHSLTLLALLGRAAGRDLVGQAVDELVEAGLALEVEDGFEPRHALLAECAIQQLAEPTARELHAHLARALDDDAESARHHASAGERHEALRKALRAAEHAERPGERASHLGLAASCATGPKANALRLEAADALLDAGRFAEAAALAAAVDGGTIEVRARAALLRGRAHWASGDRESARRELNAGIALVRGRGLSIEARLKLERVRDDLAFGASNVLENVQEAWDLAQASGAHLARADLALGSALCWYASSDACLPVLERAVDAADRSRDPDQWFMALEALCGGLQMFGGADRLDGLQAGAAAYARELGLRRWELHFTWMRGQNAYLQGDYERALEWLRHCVAEPSIAQPVRDQVAADLATALADTGRFDDASEVVGQALPNVDTPWGSQVLLFAESEAAWLAGQPRRALAAAERALGGDVLDALRPQVCAARDWALFDLQRPPGRPAKVEPLPFHAGYRLDSEAIAALSISTSSAESLFLSAADAYRGNVLRNEVRSRWAAAEIAIRRGAMARARRSLLELEEQAETTGLAPLVTRIRRTLRKAGVRRSAPRESNRKSLTGREREVMQLIAAGLTSREIALRLGLARSTVESNVRSAMRKLNAKSRVQAASLLEDDAGVESPARLRRA